MSTSTDTERHLTLKPVRVGWLGREWKAFEREIRMAFEEGLERGVLDRPYEFVFEEDAGLPQGTAQDGIASYLRLVEAGCLAVVGANYTNAAITLRDTVNEAQVPLISMCGSELFHGEYCFRMGNGDLGGDPALIVNWLKRNGHGSAAVLAPWTAHAEEYFQYFRQECRRHGVSIAAVQTTPEIASEEDLTERFRILEAAGADALVWLGYGGAVLNGSCRRALEANGWDPPRIMTTAFMQYLFGFEQFEGWVGIDQWCPDNPAMHRFHERFKARHGGKDPMMWPNALPGLCYDMAATVVEAIHRARILSGPGLKQGLERIRFMPAVTGGPNTHIAGGPYDHQLFKGDWLHFGRVRNGKLEFEGLFEPIDEN